MRVLLVVAILAFVPVVQAELGSGKIAFEELVVPQITSAPEPTIGIPWNTDHVFYHAGSTTLRGDFSGDEPVWVDVTPPYQVPINLDPLLVADEDTGRVFAGGLHGACSVMMYSDDNGETWLPSLNMCSGAQFDHQSLGVGPKPIVNNPDKVPQLNNAYYCGQLILIGCSVSLDGGVTWTAATPNVQGGCTGFHGHWRISRVTGSAFLPVGGCGDVHGLLSADILGQDGTGGLGLTGLLFSSRTIPDSHAWDGGFDPSIGIGRDDGWLYYGQADHNGARMALSKDEGLTWEPLGGAQATTWLDVGQFHDPPVVKATFADVQAGDDDRAAFTFLGLEDLDGDGKGDEYGSLYSCNEPEGGENREWHYYSAFTYDAGQTWKVNKLTDHPVQIGGIWDGGGGNPCRNLLDFNDMDIDSEGRVYIAYADGCVDNCTEEGNERYSRAPRLLRQTDGRGLFAARDVILGLDVDKDQDGIPDSEDDDIDGDGIPNGLDDDADGDGVIDNAVTPRPQDQDTPGLSIALLLGALVLLARRRS